MLGKAFFAALRDGSWATPDRWRALSIVWLVQQVAVVIFIGAAFARYSAAHAGKLAATDFMTFWSAARMAVLHGGAAAYDDPARIALQQAVGAIDAGGHYPYWYPPTFLLVTAPLGYLSYAAAALVFLLIGYALVWAAIRLIAPSGGAALVLVFSPIMLLNALIGQNGTLSCAIFAMALVWIDSRPFLAGAALGLLVCKPHLAVLAPVLFLAARRWRALGGFIATACALMIASALVLGPGAWLGFFSHEQEATAALRDFPDNWPKMQSVFTAVRLLGGSATLAFLAQGCLAATVVAMLLGPHFVAWRRGGNGPPAAGSGAADIALLTAASLLATPYMFDYDLTCLLVPMAFLLAAHGQSSPRPWECSLILLLYVLPVAARVLAVTHHIPVMPPVLFAFFVILWRRRREALQGQG